MTNTNIPRTCCRLLLSQENAKRIIKEAEKLGATHTKVEKTKSGLWYIEAFITVDNWRKIK